MSQARESADFKGLFARLATEDSVRRTTPKSVNPASIWIAKLTAWYPVTFSPPKE